MSWDTQTHQLVTGARLVNSAPEAVFSELREYSEQILAHPYSSVADRDMEQALLQRENALVNLALASYASSRDVIGTLYKRSLEASQSNSADDASVSYHRAIRLACLANRVTPGVYSFDGLAGLDNDELKRLAQFGDSDELTALLANPSRRALLGTLYQRKGVFQNLTDKQTQILVSHSARNPSLNVDDSDSSGPDLTAWNIHDGIWSLVSTAAVTPEWIYVLASLLLDLDPHSAKPPRSEEAAREGIDRWKGLHVPPVFERKEGAQTGYATAMPLTEEFRCLVAALYGRAFVERKFVVVGSPDAEDLAMRCAYYGCAKLTPNQISAGHLRDGEAFFFAAMMNDAILLTPDLRAMLEPLIPYSLEARYRRRCDQLAARYPRFDAKPLMPTDDFDEQARTKDPATSGAVSELATSLAAVKSDLASLQRLVFWGLVALVAFVWWKH